MIEREAEKEARRLMDSRQLLSRQPSFEFDLVKTNDDFMDLMEKEANVRESSPEASTSDGIMPPTSQNDILVIF
jgi:hypothetical protein